MSETIFLILVAVVIFSAYAVFMKAWRDEKAAIKEMGISNEEALTRKGIHFNLSVEKDRQLNRFLEKQQEGDRKEIFGM